MADEFNFADAILTGGGSPAASAPATPNVADAILSGVEPKRGREETGAISTITTKPITRPEVGAPDPPSFETLYKAGLVKDVATKQKIFAEARGMSPDRYGVKDGEIVYLDDNGELRSEESDATGQTIKRFAAGATSPEIVLGTAGSVLGPPGAVAGAMMGETVRQAVAGIILHDPQTAYENIFRLSAEGLVALTGELAAKGVIKAANGVLGIGKAKAVKIAGASGDDLFNINWREAADVRAMGKEFGIDLNVAQSTKSQALAAKLNLLRDLPQSSQVVQATDMLQKEQIEGAIPQFIKKTFGDIPPQQEVGRELQKAAEGAVRGLNKRRAAMTKPLYQSASGVTPKEEFSVNFRSIKRLPELIKKFEGGERRFYRGTKPGAADKTPIRDDFYPMFSDPTTGRRATFMAKDKDSVKYYGSVVEEIVAKPEAKILYEGTPEFGKVVGIDNYNPRQSLEYQMENMPGADLDYNKRTQCVALEDLQTMISRAKEAGYDAASFAYDNEKGTIIINNNAFIRNAPPKEVSSPKVDTKPVLDYIDSVIAKSPKEVRDQLTKLRGNFLQAKPVAGKSTRGLAEGRIPDGMPDTDMLPESSLETLHRTKVLLDKKIDALDGSKLAADNIISRELITAKSMLVEQMDAASPAYHTARTVHALLSGTKTNTGKSITMAKGLADAISKTPEKDLANIGALLISSNKTRPSIVTELKSQILKREDGKKVWDDAVASHLEHLFDNLPANADRNLGTAFSNAVLGRRKQRDILAAALDPDQMKTLTDFVEVLKRTGITAPKSAVGVGRGQTRKQLKREFESEMLTVLTTPLRTPKRLVADRVNELRFGRGAKELAELLLSDTSFKQVAKLKRLRPRSQKLIESLGVFLGMKLGQSTETKIARDFLQDQAPGGA